MVVLVSVYKFDCSNTLPSPSSPTPSPPLFSHHTCHTTETADALNPLDVVPAAHGFFAKPLAGRAEEGIMAFIVDPKSIVGLGASLAMTCCVMMSSA